MPVWIRLYKRLATVAVANPRALIPQCFKCVRRWRCSSVCVPFRLWLGNAVGELLPQVQSAAPVRKTAVRNGPSAVVVCSNAVCGKGARQRLSCAFSIENIKRGAMAIAENAARPRRWR